MADRRSRTQSDRRAADDDGSAARGDRASGRGRRRHRRRRPGRHAPRGTVPGRRTTGGRGCTRRAAAALARIARNLGPIRRSTTHRRELSRHGTHRRRSGADRRARLPGTAIDRAGPGPAPDPGDDQRRRGFGDQAHGRAGRFRDGGTGRRRRGAAAVDTEPGSRAFRRCPVDHDHRFVRPGGPRGPAHRVAPADRMDRGRSGTPAAGTSAAHTV